MRDGATDGVLLVDKPAGISSHAVVERVRRTVGMRRIGHAGTLDPFATGLLTLLLGRATRLLPFLDAEPKVYRATVRFGVRTTTDDLTGEPVETLPPPERESVDRAMASLTGHLLQRPPAFSAKKVGGTRAYRIARRGATPELEPAAVMVHEWRPLGWTGHDLDVEIECSGGTYVRALARDLGQATGSAAHLAALRRLRAGRFDVRDALNLDELDALDSGRRPVLSPREAVAQLPQQELDDLGAHRVMHGREVPALTAGDVVALLHADQLLAIGVREEGSLRPRVVMRDA
jgi:tRNA pseudouridine55 synthase